MPTYEYECQECGQRFEKYQNIKDKPINTCPECGGSVRRLLGTGAAVIFRGTGFYSTDYSQPGTRCGRERPCCGRDKPCDIPPCDE